MPKINGKSHRWVIDKASGWSGRRAWPTLETAEGNVAGYIRGSQSYSFSKSKEENLNLSVHIYDWSEIGSRKTRSMSRKFSTLKEAKEALESLVRLYPEFAYNPRSVLGLTK